ncbi:hypothetical protein [Nocardiopsis aegyptia]|uniref:Uncharacterized protein n=1 Tax=Nocardiopsis aegyptia TaxID=220378 RepID=A0A7Z0EQV5_9ACTN|nr:hypothetical protein [Nocardiopsis aegyptia]NYJ36066.1 hypothetical protein [Nocardiopsis aegyptia]
MSVHFDVVLSCFLREGTPPEVLAALHWHLELSDAWPEALGPEHRSPMLGTDPESRLPGGDVASLRKEPGYEDVGPRGRWGLYYRGSWIDDVMGELVTVLDLLAPHAEDGHGGYVRAEHETEPTVVVFRDGAYGPV